MSPQEGLHLVPNIPRLFTIPRHTGTFYLEHSNHPRERGVILGGLDLRGRRLCLIAARAERKRWSMRSVIQIHHLGRHRRTELLSFSAASQPGWH